MASQSVSKPGITLGDYPEKDDETPELADRFVQASVAPFNTLYERRKFRRETIEHAVLEAEKKFGEMDDDSFTAHCKRLSNTMRERGLVDASVAQAFALCRYAAQSTLGMKHYPEQLLAAWAMTNGLMIEMATGEGKSLTATLVATAAALAGIPVHVITSNEYLACRDAEEMRPLYEKLGLSCAAIQEQDSIDVRRNGYASDISYCTNKQVAFDYLRDQLDDQQPHVLRGLCFAIIDEADSVLIDEACTPLKLSREIQDPARERLYQQALAIATQLDEGVDFHNTLGSQSIELLEKGKEKITTLSQRLGDLWSGPQRSQWLVSQALCAVHCFERDKHYIVRQDQVEIVDHHTGRSMPDRAWQQGLPQLIECKERLPLSGQRETLTQISFQRFFLRYHHSCGMSGTLKEVSKELAKVYKKSVLVIPSHRERIVKNLGRQLFSTTEEKWQALLDHVEAIHSSGQPILIGTSSVANSDHLSELMLQRGLRHQVLNAREHEAEADIIATAGRVGQITVATNMAGRGTDIKIDADVAKRGGLHVVCSSPNESARSDRQLIGRCGRQGDPGSFCYFASFEDQVIDEHLRRWPDAISSHQLVHLFLLGFRPAQHFISQQPQRRKQRLLRQHRRRLIEQDRQFDEQLAFAPV